MHEDEDVAALRASLRAALTAAMKAKDGTAVRVLRTSLGAIDNAEAVPAASPAGPPVAEGPIAGAAAGLGAGEAARRQLTMADVVAVLDREVAERLAVADEHEAAGRQQPADELRTEAAVLAPFLAAGT